MSLSNWLDRKLYFILGYSSGLSDLMWIVPLLSGKFWLTVQVIPGSFPKVLFPLFNTTLYGIKCTWMSGATNSFLVLKKPRTGADGKVKKPCLLKA